MRQRRPVHSMIAGDSSFRSGRWMDLRISAFLDRTPHVRSGRDGVEETDRRVGVPHIDWRPGQHGREEGDHEDGLVVRQVAALRWAVVTNAFVSACSSAILECGSFKHSRLVRVGRLGLKVEDAGKGLVTTTEAAKNTI
jgi:hypothetical protein